MARSYEAEDAGEGYFASISDLMVGILFIFLLMLAVFAINYADEDKDKKIAELQAQIKQKDQEIAGLVKERDQLRAGIKSLVDEVEKLTVGVQGERGRLEGVRRNLLVSLQGRLEARGVKVEIDDRQGILRLASDSLFEVNEDRFTAIGEQNAKALLEEMSALLPCYSRTSSVPVNCDKPEPIFETILIEGHTDTRPTQRRGGNWTLSTDRARAFMEMMGLTGTPLRELRNPDNQLLLGLAGYGDSRPRPGIPGADDRNRRIETRFLLTGQSESYAAQLRNLDTLISGLKSLYQP